MNILAPANFAFAALIGAILLLYILRLKRRERIVSSTMLWPTALRDLQANAPWQKLRSSLLMWLQIAFIALCVLALVRPAIRVLGIGGQNMAIILDASASMQATDVSPTRFASAQSQALKLVANLSAGDSATIISAGAQTRVLAAPTSDKNALVRAINNARAFDTSNNLNDAIQLASSLLQRKKGAQIYVFSDGSAPALQDASTGSSNLQFIKIGTRNNNLAITALDARRGYSQGSQYQIFATVRNFSSREQTINLELSRDDNAVAVRPLTIAANGQQSQLFDDLNISAGLWSVRFEADDDLKSDNVAWTQIEAQRAIRVLVVTDGNLFLERALNVNPEVKLFETNLAGYANARSKGDFDVVVCDGQIPPDGSPTNQLIFGVVDADSPVVQADKKAIVSGPTVVDFDKKNPVTQFAPWSDVRFAQTLSVSLKPWAQTLVDSERAPLVVAGTRGAHRVVWCGFDLTQTDLPLRVAFPIFITNAVRWLAGAGGLGETQTWRTGAPISLDAPPTVRDIAVALPDGTQQKIAVAREDKTERAATLFSGADRVGIYNAQSEGASGQAAQWKNRFAVSLLSAQESDLKPRDALPVSNGKAVGGENRPLANRELWSYFALAALALLAVEWWIYHRGT